MFCPFRLEGIPPIVVLLQPICFEPPSNEQFASWWSLRAAVMESIGIKVVCLTKLALHSIGFLPHCLRHLTNGSVSMLMDKCLVPTLLPMILLSASFYSFLGHDHGQEFLMCPPGVEKCLLELFLAHFG